MNNTCKNAATACVAVLLGACSSMATIRTTHPHGTYLTLKHHATTELPAKVDLGSTTFGNYEFKAVEDGRPPLYGILPLDFQGGHLTLDILFFMPAIWFNLRGAYENYQVDVEHGVIRYRNDEDDPWQTYRPTPKDIADARKQFGAPVAMDASRAVPAAENTPAATISTGQHANVTTTKPANCDTPRTGIVCPNDPSRHAQPRH